MRRGFSRRPLFWSAKKIDAHYTQSGRIRHLRKWWLSTCAHSIKWFSTKYLGCFRGSSVWNEQLKSAVQTPSAFSSCAVGPRCVGWWAATQRIVGKPPGLSGKVPTREFSQFFIFSGNSFCISYFQCSFIPVFTIVAYNWEGFSFMKEKIKGGGWLTEELFFVEMAEINKKDSMDVHPKPDPADYQARLVPTSSSNAHFQNVCSEYIRFLRFRSRFLSPQNLGFCSVAVIFVKGVS